MSRRDQGCPQTMVNKRAAEVRMRSRLLLRYHCGFAGEAQENKSFLYLNECSHVMSTINMCTALPPEKKYLTDDFGVSIYSSRSQNSDPGAHTPISGF